MTLFCLGRRGFPRVPNRSTKCPAQRLEPLHACRASRSMPNGAVRPLTARLLCGRPASAYALAFVRCSQSCAVVQRRPILVLSCTAAVQKRAYGLGRIVQSVGRRTVRCCNPLVSAVIVSSCCAAAKCRAPHLPAIVRCCLAIRGALLPSVMACCR